MSQRRKNKSRADKSAICSQLVSVASRGGRVLLAVISGSPQDSLHLEEKNELVRRARGGHGEEPGWWRATSGGKANTGLTWRRFVRHQVSSCTFPSTCMFSQSWAGTRDKRPHRFLSRPLWFYSQKCARVSDCCTLTRDAASHLECVRLYKVV